jgi:hypothetical protein
MARLALLAVVVLVATPLAAAQDQAPRPEPIARNLVENVLGEGTVRSVHVVSGGRQIVIAWSAVLYRQTHTRAKNREQLRGEAELATGAVMGVLKPQVIRFTILLKDHPLAQGTRSSDGFTISYAKPLDG